MLLSPQISLPVLFKSRLDLFGAWGVLRLALRRSPDHAVSCLVRWPVFHLSLLVLYLILLTLSVEVHELCRTLTPLSHTFAQRQRHVSPPVNAVGRTAHSTPNNQPHCAPVPAHGRSHRLRHRSALVRS